MNVYGVLAWTCGTLAALIATAFAAGCFAYGFGWNPPASWRVEYLVGASLSAITVLAVAAPLIWVAEVESGHTPSVLRDPRDEEET